MRAIKELMSLDGRAAMVTGGGGHIGSVICDALAEMGASIAVLDINAESCAETAQRVESAYQVETLSLPLDLSDQRVVCIITGSGLKDPDLAVSSSTGQTIEVEPTIDALEALELISAL